MMEYKDKTQIAAVAHSVPTMETKFSDCPNEMGVEDKKEEGEEEPARGNWTGRFDFLLSLLGYSVGLGNVWRFPYLCYNNGGGAFLIPFTVMLVIAGLPLMFMELSFGQYAALGPVAVYNKFCPLFRGLGYGMVIVSSIVMLYYNLIIAWTIYYMAVSFMSIFYQLPWQNCDADWSTKNCYSYEEADACEALNGTYYLRQCLNQSYVISHNIAALAETVLRRPPAEEYFTNQVLGLSSGIEETGQIRLGMAICLLAAWLIVFLCLCKGVQSSGKVVYFTALFPYVVLVILFFRGVTLPGASTGILFYLTPDFSQLLNAQVWGDAAVQIFFALSPAWGGLITLSSYNKFSNNCYIDALIVAASNIATSFFAGLVIFSVIGFLAHELDVGVDRVVDQGAGLAFIVYPEVVTRLPISPLWSILFFVMLLTLGLDSQFALMETVTTAILDRFPNFRQKKVWVVLTVAVFGYLGGLIFTTNSGMYWLQLMDKYAANWSVLIIAIGECILIAWIYGAEKFCGDIQSMIGKQTKLWVFFWSAMWRVITPSALVFILVFNWIEYKPASYGHYVYPMWADAVGWTLGVLPVVVVVLMAVDQICSGPDDLTIMEKARALSRPTEEWGHQAGGTTALLALRPPAELSPPVLLLHGRPVLRERGAWPAHAHPLVAMRKTSQDGGEYPATSGVENEVKKSKGLLSELKTKTIGKRTAPNLSEESDDGVVEPLLQKNTNSAVQSAKYFAKAKADTVKEITKLFNDKKTQNASTSGFGTTETLLSEKDQADSPNLPSIPLHNHMNTNVFHNLDNVKVNGTAKSQVLVEIDGSKQSLFNPSPLIFTTAKIHTDGKSNHMEPVQMTPAPILSTVEASVSKDGSITTNEKKISNGTSIMNTLFSQPLKPEKAENTINFSTTVKSQNPVSNSDNSNKPLSTNTSDSLVNNPMTTTTIKPDKTQLNYPLKCDSLSATSKLITPATNINIPVESYTNDAHKVLGKPSISEMPKSNIVVKTSNSPLEEYKSVDSSAQIPHTSQTHKKEKLNIIDSDSKARNIKSNEVKQLTDKNIKSPIVIEEQTSSSIKPNERQKNISAEEDPMKIKIKIVSSKNPECFKDSIAKSKSSSKIPTQSKANESKLNKNACANDRSNLNSKEALNNTVIPTKEASISKPIVKPAHDPLLPSVETSTIGDTSLTNITDSNVAKTHVITPKTTAATSNSNKTQIITTNSTTNTRSYIDGTQATTYSSNTDKTQVTSTANTAGIKTDKTPVISTKAPISMIDKASSSAIKTQVKVPTSLADKVSLNASKTKALPTKVATVDKVSTNASKTHAVTATSISDKARLGSNKSQAIPSKPATSISDKAGANTNKTQATMADKTSTKANKIQPITKAATSIADKAGSNTNQSQPVTTNTHTPTGVTTSSNVNKTQSLPTKTETPTNTKPATATSTKTPTKPISVSTVAKISTNKPSSTTPSAKIAQVTSPGATTAKPLVGKTAQVSTDTTIPIGITSPPTNAAPEHSNNSKTNESSNKIGSKSSDKTKDIKVTKA